ncbi:hypothetical protein P4050_16660 [Pseudomonas aeruginosa]|nr:hypothetical protein [Pseudomonas aeruginosa]
MDAYSQAMDERANQIVENLGTMERAWRTVGDIAKGAWDEMLGVGRTETPEERLEQLSGPAFKPARQLPVPQFSGRSAGSTRCASAFQRNSMSDEERGKQFTDALQEIQDEGEKAQAARLKAYLDSEATRGQQSMDRLLETVRTNKEKRDKLNRELDRSIAAILPRTRTTSACGRKTSPLLARPLIRSTKTRRLRRGRVLHSISPPSPKRRTSWTSCRPTTGTPSRSSRRSSAPAC